MMQCRTKNRNRIIIYGILIQNTSKIFFFAAQEFAPNNTKSYQNLVFSTTKVTTFLYEQQVNCLWQVKYIYDKGQTRSGDLLFGCQKNPIKKQRGGSRIRINQRSCMCIFMEKQSSFFMNIQYKGGEKEKGGLSKGQLFYGNKRQRAFPCILYILIYII